MRVSAHTNVLLVKNGEAAAEYARACLEAAGLASSALILADGNEAAALLFRDSAPIMPLKLAVVSQELRPLAGVELLARLRADPVYRHLKVVMLADEALPHVKDACGKLAASYQVRPDDAREYCRLLVSLVRDC
jgi:CheY-like chemotaxis protein